MGPSSESTPLKNLRNVAIILLVALAIEVLPGGGNAADAALAAITLSFALIFGLLGFRLYKSNGMTLAVMSERQRWLTYGGVGLIVLMFAGADELFRDGLGTLAFFAGVGLGIYLIYTTVRDANSY